MGHPQAPSPLAYFKAQGSAARLSSVLPVLDNMVATCSFRDTDRCTQVPSEPTEEAAAVAAPATVAPTRTFTSSVRTERREEMVATLLLHLKPARLQSHRRSTLPVVVAAAVPTILMGRLHPPF